MILWIFTLRRTDKPSEEEVNKIIDSIYDLHLEPDSILVTSENELNEAIARIQNKEGEKVYG
jgi:hypothetical protein